MDIIYNGIGFAVTKTNQLLFQPQWSDDGATYLYTRVLIDVQGLLNPAAMAYSLAGGGLGGGGTPDPSPGALPPESLVAIRHALSQPRQQLEVSSATGDLITPSLDLIVSPLPGFTTDLNNGPVPGTVRVFNINGAKTWYVHWTCETWIHECPDELSASDPLISNRYSRSDQMDEQWRSTIVTHGIAVFRTDILEATGQVADDFRSRILPPVPLGFQRRRISVTAVPNRNALQWSCVDEERFFDIGDSNASGSFITDVDATWGLSTITPPTGIPSGQTLGHFYARIRGDKRASNWTLTQRAFALAAGKVPIGVAGKGWISNISVTQSLTSREVTLNLSYMFNATDPAPLITGLPTDALRVDNIFRREGGVNPQPPNSGGTRGTANLRLLVADLEEACSGAAVVPCPDESPDQADGQPCGPPPEIQVQGSDELDPQETDYSQDTIEAPYNYYTVQTQYQRDASILMAPVAGPVGTTFGFGQAPDTAFFRLAAPQTRVTVNWRAERVGRNVQVPNPQVNNSNYVLLYHTIRPGSPVLGPDGDTHFYSAEGEYIYGTYRSMGVNEELAMGLVPWIADNFSDLYIKQDDYVHGIIDDPSGQ